MIGLVGLLSTAFLFFLIMSLFIVGPRNMLRWPLVLFKRKPKYVIVKNRGSYFPIKRKPFAYRVMYERTYGTPANWKRKSNVQAVCLKFPGRYGVSSMEKAKAEIERLEDKEIEQVPPNGYEGCFWRGNPTFFEPKSYEPTRPFAALFKMESKEETIDGMIDAKFSGEEVMKTKIGAERDLRSG